MAQVHNSTFLISISRTFPILLLLLLLYCVCIVYYTMLYSARQHGLDNNVIACPSAH